MRQRERNATDSVKKCEEKYNKRVSMGRKGFM